MLKELGAKFLGAVGDILGVAKPAVNKPAVPDMPNAKFATENKLFIKACELGGAKATKRQAAKFRNGCGRAFGFKEQAKQELNTENYP